MPCGHRAQAARDGKEDQKRQAVEKAGRSRYYRMSRACAGPLQAFGTSVQMHKRSLGAKAPYRQGVWSEKNGDQEV